MLLRPNSLRNDILKILRISPPATAKDLLKLIKSKLNKAPTVQGLQKELRRMISEGIVVRAEKKYFLNLAWCLDFVNFSARLAGDCIGNVTISSLIPDNKKARYKLQSLLQLQDFWTEAMFILLQNSKAKTAMQWIPYPWFVFVNESRSDRFLSSIKLGRFITKSIVGDDSPLALAMEKFNDGSNKNHFPKNPFHLEMSKYYTLIDNYLITVSMDDNLNKLIQSFFRMSRNKSEGYLKILPQVASGKGNIKLEITNGGYKVTRIRKIFEEYFQ